ncbi:hypothetical protein Taro_024009 [Colocasia esculenta]|uniref:Uncharacterized protein n=1 Tax=Colocasia esculenta TaxID=4460 RepID=A0A843VG84_COLES|nr:hypothetical protein [Colocasia esculenta]
MGTEGRVPPVWRGYRGTPLRFGREEPDSGAPPPSGWRWGGPEVPPLPVRERGGGATGATPPPIGGGVDRRLPTSGGVRQPEVGAQPGTYGWVLQPEAPTSGWTSDLRYPTSGWGPTGETEFRTIRHNKMDHLRGMYGDHKAVHFCDEKLELTIQVWTPNPSILGVISGQELKQEVSGAEPESGLQMSAPRFAKGLLNGAFFVGHVMPYIFRDFSEDSSTLARVRNYLHSGDIMREESLRQASFPCAPLNTQMSGEEFYRVETTGAIVTLCSSISLIYFYCSRLPSDGYFKPFPRFIIDKDLNSCTLYLPKCCPLSSVQVEGKQDLLKHIACLEACKKLHELHALTDNLLPWCEVEDKAADQESGCFSHKDTQFSNYFPEELVDSWQSFYAMGLYHCYNISLSQNFLADVPFRDIIVVTKCDLGSDFASTFFYLEESRGRVTVNMHYVGTINLSPQQVHMAREFQSHILSMLIHQNFHMRKDTVHCQSEDAVSTAAYLVLPSITNEKGFDIDWHCVSSVEVQHCCHGGASRWIQTGNGAICSCMVQNSVVYAPHNGYIYSITGISDNLHGNSAMPSKSREVLTYKEYYQSRHGISLLWPNESLLIGRHLFKVQNFLVRRQFHKEKEWGTADVQLPPELCIVRLSPVTLSTLYSYTFVPSVLWRLESMLLATGLRRSQLDHCMQTIIPSSKVLEALTTKKCREQFSLESLETLGDSFLKYAVSLHLFGESTHHHEGVLSHKRERMISNAALYRLGCSHQLPGFIRNQEFHPPNWMIPGSGFHSFVNEEVISSTSVKVYNRGTRFMKSKTVADSVEALIGVYLSFGGEKAALHFLKWLGMTIMFNKEVVDNMAFVSKPEMYVNIELMESLLQYSFANPSLLVEALTHGSYQIAEIPRCYQRLEYLGDAVLDHLITVHLYNKYPNLSPGLLTDLRSASVNNDCYAHAAVKAGLNKQILHQSSELHRQMTFYLSHFTRSFSGSSYGWQAGFALPKVLGDVIESIAGAIFLDSGFNKEAVWKSIRPLLEPLVTPETVEYHPVRELEELCSRKSYPKKFSKVCEDGIASITVEVEAGGETITMTRTAVNKKTAKKLAARAVLDALRTRSTQP